MAKKLWKYFQGVTEFLSDITPYNLILFLISDGPVMVAMLRKEFFGIHWGMLGLKVCCRCSSTFSAYFLKKVVIPSFLFPKNEYLPY